MMRPNLTGDYGLSAQGVVFDPLSMLSMAFGMVGSLVQSGAQQDAAAAEAASLDSQAKQLDQQATQARAAGQRQMIERQRQTDLTRSTLQARAAASGAGAEDDTVLGLDQGILGRGEEQALTELANGENQGRGLNDQAMAKRASAAAAINGGQMSSMGTLIGGIGTGFGKFANTNPTARASANGFKLPDGNPG